MFDIIKKQNIGYQIVIYKNRWSNQIKYKQTVEDAGNSLCIVPLKDNSEISIVKTGTYDKGKKFEYMKNSPGVWQSYNVGDVITANSTDKIYFRSTDNITFSFTSSNYMKFQVNNEFNVEGNVMSLLNYSDSFDKYDHGYCFYNLFYMSKIKNISADFLPAMEVPGYGYANMFQNCNLLENAPNLPATKVNQYSYQYMFSSCSKLTTAPNLPATDLTNAIGCYNGMFSSSDVRYIPNSLPAMSVPNYAYTNMFRSSKVTYIPENFLPATTLGSYCYQYMFSDCSNLSMVNVILPATTLKGYCYDNMFSNCYNLYKVPKNMLPATTLIGYCYNSMFKGCSAIYQVPNLPATTLAVYCYNMMFYGCSSLVDVPSLPATTLLKRCYASMFYNCRIMITAPDLPATELIDECYDNMFGGCSKLNYIKALFTTTPSSSYTNNWVLNVSSSGTFVKNSAATWDVTGVNGIPSGWTVTTVAA